MLTSNSGKSTVSDQNERWISSSCRRFFFQIYTVYRSKFEMQAIYKSYHEKNEEKFRHLKNYHEKKFRRLKNYHEKNEERLRRLKNKVDCQGPGLRGEIWM